MLPSNIIKFLMNYICSEDTVLISLLTDEIYIYIYENAKCLNKYNYHLHTLLLETKV